MRNSYWFAFLGFIVTCADAFTSAGALLPQNIDLPHELVAAVSRMYDASPSFRAQCGRIAGASNAHVRVRFDIGVRPSCRAITEITRRRGSVCADIRIPPGSASYAEILSHEFEHIIEQLEGLDLRTLSKVRNSGVHEVQRELYETDRAQRAGRLVAEELRLTRSSQRSTD